MMQAHGRIVPVLLSGGTGSRLWPLSRETYPKQLLSLLDERTLLQQTALRVADPLLFTNPMVIANAEHRFVIGEQLRAVGVSDPTIVLEPFGRNTAPAVAIAALLASETDPDAVMLVLPVDHWVRDHAAFRAAVSSGLRAARHGRFVLFGLRPTSPATRFGYIRMGDGFAAAPDVRDVASFVEKPDLAVVERFLACNEHLWNSGIFLLPARLLIEELETRAPEVLAACRGALAGARRDLDFLRLEEGAFETCPSTSIDYAIMEKTEGAVVITAPFDWNDSACRRRRQHRLAFRANGVRDRSPAHGSIRPRSVSIQAQVINLLSDLQKDLGLTYLFVSHDLRVVRHIANRVAVMYLGEIVEIGPVEGLYRNPSHPYTQALLAAVPRRHSKAEPRQPPIGGEMPSARNPPSGCRFHTRCPIAQPICAEMHPTLRLIDEDRSVACHFA